MPFRPLAPAVVVVAALLALAAPAQAQGRRAEAGGDQISLQQFLAQRDRIFDRIDANHDGQITQDEVAAFQARMENARAGAEIRSGRERPEGGGRQLQRLADLTRTGPLTRAAWEGLMTERFRALDRAGTGYISREQMRGGGRAAPPAAGDAAAMPAPPQP